LAQAGSGYRLSGKKRFVACASDADGFLVNAAGPDGAVLCYVPAAAVKSSQTNTVDGGGWGDLFLDGAEIPADNIIAGANRAPDLATGLIDSMLIALGAELLGVAGAALDMAVEYIKMREQFDRPIGSFQALQHRAVNDYVEVESTRSLVFQAAEVADAGRGTSAMASAVKAKASAAALSVAKSAIQMHGGIGFTDEHDIGLYLKRAMALSAQYGNEAAHRARYARLAGIEPA
jgi:alkylation response protein AidB-like acyl-CoA dehydrogenase